MNYNDFRFSNGFNITIKTKNTSFDHKRLIRYNIITNDNF